MKTACWVLLSGLCLWFCGAVLASEKQEQTWEETMKSSAASTFPALVEELSGCVIEDFAFNDADAKGALDSLFKVAEGKLKYIKGYQILQEGEMKPRRLSWSLKNVEFGVALYYVCDNFDLVMQESGGLLTFRPVEWNLRSTQVIPLKEATARKLNIGQTAAATPEVKQALAEIGIDCTKAAYFETKKLLAIEASQKALQRLSVLIELMEGGYDIKYLPPVKK